jgi:hypothetical protein
MTDKRTISSATHWPTRNCLFFQPSPTAIGVVVFSSQDPKADGSPLTQADLEANAIICTELKKL